jgi:hypothetical protein
MPKETRDKRTSKIAQRYDADSRKDRGFSHRQGILDTSDHEINWFTPASKDDKKGITGRNVIMIIPYPITNVNKSLHPGIDEEECDYKLSVFSHKNVGVNDAQVVCPRTFDKACPICEEQNQVNFNENEDLWRSLKAVERPVYQIIDIDNQDKGIQLWQIAYNSFENLVKKKLEADAIRHARPKQCPFDPAYKLGIDFMSHEDSKWGYKLSEFEIMEVKDDFSDMIDETLPLDDLMIDMSYDKIRNLHLGIEDEDIATGDKEDEQKEDKSELKQEQDEKKARPHRVRNTKSKEPENKCPFANEGGKFGENCGEFGEKDGEGYFPCDKCDEELYSECAKLSGVNY